MCVKVAPGTNAHVNEEKLMDTPENMLQELVTKAQEDSDFRSGLLANPRSALKEAFDIELPDDFNLEVHEDDARTAHLVLPFSGELTDGQLRRAAGGGGWPCESDWVV